MYHVIRDHHIDGVDVFPTSPYLGNVWQRVGEPHRINVRNDRLKTYRKKKKEEERGKGGKGERDKSMIGRAVAIVATLRRINVGNERRVIRL